MICGGWIGSEGEDGEGPEQHTAFHMAARLVLELSVCVDLTAQTNRPKRVYRTSSKVNQGSI